MRNNEQRESGPNREGQGEGGGERGGKKGRERRTEEGGGY